MGIRYALIFFLTTLLFFSCKKDNCEPVIIDLIGEVNLGSTLTIVGSEPFNLRIVIKSIRTKCHENDVIPPTKARLKVSVSYDLGISWDETFDTLFDIPAFPIGETITENFFLTFEDPGTYKFEVCADATNVVKERDEQNCN